MFPGCRGRSDHEVQHRFGAWLLRQGLSEYCPGNSTSEEIPVTVRPDGKPELDLPGVYFNSTNCEGAAACALASSEIGVDMEKIRPFGSPVLRRTLSADEKEFFSTCAAEHPDRRDELFFRFWTLKEAAAKYTGEGIRRDFRELSFSMEPCGMKNAGRVSSSLAGLFFYQFILEGQYVLSVCSESELMPRLRVLDSSHAGL